MTEEKIIQQAQVEIHKANTLIVEIHHIKEQLHQLIEEMQTAMVKDQQEVTE